MAIALIAKIRGPKLNNTWAFQVMVLTIAEEVYYDIKEGN